MSTQSTIVRVGPRAAAVPEKLLEQYGCGPIQFTGTTNAFYLEADERLFRLQADPGAWTRKAVLDVAASGSFPSDRTIAGYAPGIWNIVPCPVT
jgi:glucan phosphorylase